MAQCYRFESVNSTVLVSVYDRRADLQQIVTKTLADLVCGILSRRNMIDINPPRRLQFSLRCRSTRCSCWASQLDLRIAELFCRSRHRRLKIVHRMLLAVAVLCAGPAAASPWSGGGFYFSAQAPQPPGGWQGQGQPQPQPRDVRRPDRPPDRRPDGRMTDEERRNLNRDLDRANREIYKGRR